MRIVEIRESPIRIHRHPERTALSGNLTTSLVEVVTDVHREGRRVTGRGFSSIGRYAQGGLIRERFAPRLLHAPVDQLLDGDGVIDPFRAWDVMMSGEKPGGHGDRSVAVGTLDMALWDIASKMASEPLHRFIARMDESRSGASPQVHVYTSGGYLHAKDDLARLAYEFGRMGDLGFTHAKMKIGATSLDGDLRRIDVAARAIGGHGRLAVDAMNALSPATALEAARRFIPLGLWWFEDACDPLDFETQALPASEYPEPIGAGEALFSSAEARLLDIHGGLRRDRDVLIFDPVHRYGLPGYLRVVREFCGRGWPRSAFRPHGGHLFGLQVAAGLGLAERRSIRSPFGLSPGCPRRFAHKAGS
jgi:L-alanine-DL-glutamate epimerase-like enolase superfamily enzyme